MADSTITNLTALAAADVVSSDVLPIVDVSAGSSGNKKITWTEVLAAIGLGGGLFAATTKNLTAGFTGTQYDIGTQSTGTITPAFANGNEQKMALTGNITLGVPTCTAGTASSMCLEITITSGTPTIGTGSFTKVVGSFTTTSGHKFKCFIHVGDAGSLLNIVAMQ